MYWVIFRNFTSLIGCIPENFQQEKFLGYFLDKLILVILWNVSYAYSSVLNTVTC